MILYKCHPAAYPHVSLLGGLSLNRSHYVDNLQIETALLADDTFELGYFSIFINKFDFHIPVLYASSLSMVPGFSMSTSCLSNVNYFGKCNNGSISNNLINS